MKTRGRPLREAGWRASTDRRPRPNRGRCAHVSRARKAPLAEAAPLDFIPRVDARPTRGSELRHRLQRHRHRALLHPLPAPSTKTHSRTRQGFRSPGLTKALRSLRGAGLDHRGPRGLDSPRNRASRSHPATGIHCRSIGSRQRCAEQAARGRSTGQPRRLGLRGGAQLASPLPAALRPARRREPRP